MHPNTYRANLLGHDLRDEAFVIMSFAPEFEDRWQQVIQPAIQGIGFTANRVDYNFSGESIVYDILDGIAHARLIVGDITSVQMQDAAGTFWPQRNGNVMWEVGIAHAMRLPDEVVLIRSDTAPSIFDLTQFRAFLYDPKDINNAKQFLTQLMNDRLRSIDQTRSTLVANVARSIDALGIHFLFSSVPADGREFTIKPNVANGLNTPRLFDLGIIEVARFEIVAPTNDCPNGRMFYYRLTKFGQAVLVALLEHIGFERSVMNRSMSSTSTKMG